MRLLSYDKNINRLETAEGVLTLPSLFFPFFIEMVLVNMIGTVNTLALSRYSDQAVAAVGAASQLMGMIFTFYGVISSGASIVISQNLGAHNKERAANAAAISILFSATLSIIIGTLLSIFAHSILSRLVGAQEYDHANRLNKQNLKITILFNVTLSLLINLFGGYLLQLFTDNPEILTIAKSILLIDLFVEIGRGFNHIENNSLRGAGDVVYPMVVSITSCWIMSILFSYVLGVKLGLGLYGCWIAFAMDELFRGTLYYLRWRSRKWTTKSIVN